MNQQGLIRLSFWIKSLYTLYTQPNDLQTTLWLHNLFLDVLILQVNKLQFIWAKVFHLMYFNLSWCRCRCSNHFNVFGYDPNRLQMIPYCKKYSRNSSSVLYLSLSWLICRKPIHIHAPDMESSYRELIFILMFAKPLWWST